MGPVWEANHVWLIFLIVILFTAFPSAFAALSVALFWSFHLVLAGIVLRGAAFVFRAHGHEAARTSLSWGAVFGAASVFTPLLFGASLGALSGGGIRVVDGVVERGSEWAWLGILPLAIGALALAVCAYLAAVYLTLETEGALREDFRQRALGVWLVSGMLSLVTLLLTYTEAPHLWERLTGGLAAPAVVVGALLAPASAFALWRQRFYLARALVIGQVVLLLMGWALSSPALHYLPRRDAPQRGSAARHAGVRALDAAVRDDAAPALTVAPFCCSYLMSEVYDLAPRAMSGGFDDFFRVYRQANAAWRKGRACSHFRRFRLQDAEVFLISG